MTWKRTADFVLGGQTSGLERAMFDKQARQPMTSESPKPIAASIAALVQEPAETRVVRINGFGPARQFRDPKARERGAEPDGSLFPNSEGDGGRNEWRFRNDF